MRTFISLLVFALLPATAIAAEELDWAYPAPPPGLARPDPNQIVKVPGSDKEYTQAQINDPFGPPDWFPNDHAPMPSVVAHGVKPAVRGCAMCHLTTGDGHPELANVSGLPVGYFTRQMAEFAQGHRKNSRATAMIEIAKGISDEDARAAAEYFGARKPDLGYLKVIEAAEAPKSVVGDGGKRYFVPDGGTEPVGQRILMVAVDDAGAKSRNPRTGFVAYVPPGSLAKGEALATTGGGKTLPCAICHGEGLKGLGDVPALAHRGPLYLVRQLLDIKNGTRNGTSVALMKQVVEKLDLDDIIALAAYASSREP